LLWLLLHRVGPFAVEEQNKKRQKKRTKTNRTRWEI